MRAVVWCPVESGEWNRRAVTPGFFNVGYVELTLVRVRRLVQEECVEAVECTLAGEYKKSWVKGTGVASLRRQR